MALFLLLVYCLFLIRLTGQMLRYGEVLLGKHAASMIMPVMAFGAYLCIMETLAGGIVLLIGATVATIAAGLVFSD